MNDSAPNLPRLLAELREGDSDARAILLAIPGLAACFWLRPRLVSRLPRQVRRVGHCAADASEACRDLPQFRGGSEAELLAWLRQILCILGHEFRRYGGTQQRDVAREVSLEQSLAQSSQRLANMLAMPGSSPSQQAVRHEEEVMLADVLARLPDDHREVLILRNLEGLSHEEVVQWMGMQPRRCGCYGCGPWQASARSCRPNCRVGPAMPAHPLTNDGLRTGKSISVAFVGVTLAAQQAKPGAPTKVTPGGHAFGQ